ncbi:MAG: hypothetical protein M3015_13225 [Bacteroidota bacterium]|nr:hypothetical protein [Bacteroidota bacterium]
MIDENEDSLESILQQASEFEKKEEDNKAIELYQDITKRDNLNINAYNKLMKLFRKSKEYKKELNVINTAIKSYEAYYKKHRPKHSQTVDDLSSKLNKSLGLVDKRGVSLNDPEPIGKWKKRKEIVEKKLAK